MDSIADALKHIETLKLTVNSEHIALIRRLSSTCKHLKQLELDHAYDNDINSNFIDNMIEAACRFRVIESLELSRLRSFDSISALVEHLPKLHRLRHLKLFMNKPQRSNAFIPLLSSKSSSLKTLTITSWNYFDQSWPSIFLSASIFKEMIVTIFKPPRIQIELKAHQDEHGFATTKRVIWCDKRSQWRANDSVFLSLQLNEFIRSMFSLIIAFILLLAMVHLGYI